MFTTRSLTLIVVAWCFFSYPLFAAGAELFGLPTGFFSIPARGMFVLIYILIAVAAGIRLRNSVVALRLIWLMLFWVIYGFRYFSDIRSGVFYYDPDTATLILVFWCIVPMALVMLMGRRLSYDINAGLMRTALVTSMFVLLAVMFSGVPEGEGNGTRASLVALNAISVSELGGTCMLLGFCCLFWPVRIGRLEALFALGVGATLLFLGASRGPLLATILTIYACVLVRASPGLRVLGILLPILVLGLFFSAFTALLSTADFLLLSRLASAAADPSDDLSVLARLHAFQGAWSVFTAAPLLGSTVTEPSTGYYPHNIFLESLMATGVVGTGILLILIWGAVRRGMYIVRNAPSMSWAPTLFLFATLMASSSGSIWAASSFWLMLGILIASSVGPRRVLPHLHGHFQEDR